MRSARLSHQARARRYLQASMSAGYTGLPKPAREAAKGLMAEHERAYSRVREHALAGASRDFDMPLQSGERGHQRELREREGLTEHDVRTIRDELRAKPARSSASAGPSAALSGARAGGSALGAAAPGKGSLFLQIAGVFLGLSLIYLLVAGKGTKALGGIVTAVTGGVHAFVSPVDPIAKLESALGAKPVSASPTGGSSAGGGAGTSASAAEAGGVSGSVSAPGPAGAAHLPPSPSSFQGPHGTPKVSKSFPLLHKVPPFKVSRVRYPSGDSIALTDVLLAEASIAAKKGG